MKKLEPLECLIRKFTKWNSEYNKEHGIEEPGDTYLLVWEDVAEQLRSEMDTNYRYSPTTTDTSEHAGEDEWPVSTTAVSEGVTPTKAALQREWVKPLD